VPDDFRDLFERPDFLRPEEGLPVAVPRHPSGIFGDARWAGEEDLERFLAPPRDGDALVLRGASPIVADPSSPKGFRALLFRDLYFARAERSRHILCVSTTGGGKTTRVFVPFVEPWASHPGRSLIAAVTKPEYAAGLLEAARRAGKEAWLLRLGRAGESATFNPCSGPMTESRALDIVTRFHNAARRRSDSGGEWVSDYAVPLNSEILLRLAEEEGEASLGRWADVIRLPPERLAAWARANPRYGALARFAKDLDGNVNAGTVMMFLRALVSELDEANRLILDGSEIDPARLAREPGVIVCLMDENSLDAYRVLWGLVFSEFLSRIIEAAGACPGGRCLVEILLAFDEFAAIGPVKNFEHHAHGLRSRGVSVLALVQSLTQLRQNYGDAADQVRAAFATQIFLPPVDIVDAHYVSNRIGRMTASKETVREIRDAGTGEVLQSDRTIEPMERALALPEEIARPPRHEYLGGIATILLPEGPPARAWLRPAYEQPEFTRFFEPRPVPARAAPLVRREPLSVPAADDPEVQRLKEGPLRWNLASPRARLFLARLEAELTRPELLDFLHGLVVRGATLESCAALAGEERRAMLRRLLRALDPRGAAFREPDPFERPPR